MGLFAGQVVVVTGAGGTLGRAYALELAREGASVVVNNRADGQGTGTTSSTAERVVDEIRRAGGVAVADCHDVGREPDAIVATALDQFGAVHAVINNAGNMVAGEIDELSLGDVQQLLDVHVLGSIGITRAAWPHLREQGYGRVLNTTSSTIFGFGPLWAYATAKSAVIGLTKSLADAGAEHGIKVNAVMPTAYSKMNAGSAFDAVTIPHFPAQLVAPWVVALASRDVPCSGEVFVCGGGRAAQLFYGTVPGAAGPTSASEALERFEDTFDKGDSTRIDSLMQGVGYELEHVGVDPALLAGS